MKMGCVKVLFNTDYFNEKKNRFKAFHEIFAEETRNSANQLIYYKHALFENLDYSNELSNAPKGTNDFVLAKIEDGNQKVSKTSEGIQPDCAVLMLSYDFNEIETVPENLTLFDLIISYVNENEISYDNTIPLVVLFISRTGNHHDIRSLLEPFDTDQVLRISNRFIHFMFGADSQESYKRCMTRIASIGIVLSPNFALSNLNEAQLAFVYNTILFEKYQSNRGVEKNKNIAHLIAKMDVAWAVNCICNKFPPKHVFRLLMEKERCTKCIERYKNYAKSIRCPGVDGSYCSSQNPLMIAAIHSKKAVLASFMNFYSSSIDMTELHSKRLDNKACYDSKEDVTKDCMSKESEDNGRCNLCIIKELLHQTDSRNKNLTFYIITAEEKCLGAYGTILQFEEDFHIRKSIEFVGKKMNKGMNTEQMNKKNQGMNDEDVDEDYLRLQTCIQKYVGSSLKSTQVLSLFEATRKPKKMSIMITVAYALLGVYLFQMGLYLLDVITDSLVAKDYYQDWTTPNSSKVQCQWNSSSSRYLIVSVDNTANVTALSEYPDCLSDMWKFLYTTGFMVLPTLFYLIEMLRHYKKILGKEMDWRLIPLGVIIFPLLTPFWPLILFIWKSYPLAILHWKSGPRRRHYLEQFEKISLIVLVVHLIEVCIESSFMAILQWYTVMPQMLNDLHSYLIVEQDIDPSIILSKVSFIFSILSLAWGFTSYSAEQKDGALDMTFNPSGRILLFISNLCLIFARINSLVLFMYFWGPGEFKPGMFLISIHVIVMMFIHYYTLYYKSKHEFESAGLTTLQTLDRNESLKNENDINQANDDTTNHTLGIKESKMDIMYYLTVFYVCLVNGLANIFINNFVNISLNRFKHIGAKKKKTFHRQICGDLLFFLQNVVMVGLGLTIDVKPINDPVTATAVAGVICGCHFLGLAIKVVYYKYFHIWKDLTPRITTHGVKRGLEKSDFRKNMIKNIRKYSVKSKIPKETLENDVSQDMELCEL